MAARRVNENPLIEHPELIEEIIRWFQERAQALGLNVCAIVWMKVPSYILRASDYRTYKVFNIPFLVAYEHGTNFFLSTIKLLVETRRELENINNAGNAADNEMRLRMLKDSIRRKAREDATFNFYVSSLATFLDTTVDMTVDSFLMGFGVICLGRLQRRERISGILFAIFDVIFRLMGFHSSIPALLNFVFQRLEITDKRTMNYATVLTMIYDHLCNRTDYIMECNVLLVAIDETYGRGLLRSFRTNDGSFAQFMKIPNLQGSPTARSYRNGSAITICRDIFDLILSGDNIDFETLDNYISDSNQAFRDFGFRN